MSHFSVIVIGPDHEAQLAPYHEFECTGLDDQYVENIDKTAECRAEYEKDTETRLRDPQGALHTFFDEKGAWRPEFSQVDPESRPFFKGDTPRRTYLVPDGWAKVEVPASIVLTFREWVKDWCSNEELSIDSPLDLEGKHKYGYTRIVNGEVDKVIRRTNQNAHWDWYEVGGRWTGWLKLKPGCEGVVGRTGLMTEPAKPGTADVMRKGDIDFELMCEEAGAKAAATWDHAARLHGGETWRPWSAFDRDAAARDAYHAQPPVKRMREDKDFRDNFWDGWDRFLLPRAEYVRQARVKACVPFAVVKDGRWYERGRMGWWGTVSDEQDGDAWAQKVSELTDGLPDDTIITVVDAHI